MINQQMDFGELHPDFPKPISAQTRMLLHYIDEEAEEIRSELSLPISITGTGYVEMWKERIILNPIPFTKVILVNVDDEDDGGDIEIEVARR